MGRIWCFKKWHKN